MKSPEKLIPYECGLDPLESPRMRISIRYFLVAILFVIFEVEVAFLYPWAMIFREFSDAGEGVLAFSAGAIFLSLLIVGLIYVWGKGALEWEE
ncbi:MAG: NADH-quinone oxidoreductase subunit A [Pseudomonadota bacterium]